MHPVDCLLSRIANTQLPDRDPIHERAQLDAAISLVQSYARYLLEQGGHVREVLKINEAVYRAATHERRAINLYLTEGVDVAAASLEDPRLPGAYLAKQLPRLQAQLATERERLSRPQTTPARNAGSTPSP